MSAEVTIEMPDDKVYVRRRGNTWFGICPRCPWWHSSRLHDGGSWLETVMLSDAHGHTHNPPIPDTPHNQHQEGQS